MRACFGKPRDVDARLQPHAQAHRRQRRVVGRRRVVARRIDVRAPRARRGEAQRVVDRAARDLVVAREAGEDRQPGRVRRRPAGRAERVRAQVPDRAGARRPAAAASGRARTARRACTRPCRASSACRSPSDCAPALDVHASSGSDTAPCPTRRRTRTRRASAASVFETTSNGMPIGPPSYRPEPKSGCSAGADADRLDHLRRVRGDRQRVDALVPRVRRGKDRALRRARQPQRAARRRRRAAARRRPARSSRFIATRRDRVDARPRVPSPSRLAKRDRAAVLLDERARDREPEARCPGSHAASPSTRGRSARRPAPARRPARRCPVSATTSRTVAVVAVDASR